MLMIRPLRRARISSTTSRVAVARPMPLAAPETTTTFPTNLASPTEAMTGPPVSRSDETVKADPALGGGEAEPGDDDQHRRHGGDAWVHAVLDGAEDLHWQGHVA